MLAFFGLERARCGWALYRGDSINAVVTKGHLLFFGDVSLEWKNQEGILESSRTA